MAALGLEAGVGGWAVLLADGNKPFRTGEPSMIFVRKPGWRLVRAEGLEPPQLSSLEPKSSASTSSATPARQAFSGADLTFAAARSAKPGASVKSETPL
jgi:hypothetical protein